MLIRNIAVATGILFGFIATRFLEDGNLLVTTILTLLCAGISVTIWKSIEVARNVFLSGNRKFKFLIEIASGFLILGFLLIAYYNARGQHVDANGFLVEEFWALATGLIIFVISVVVIGLTLLRWTIKINRNK